MSRLVFLHPTAAAALRTNGYPPLILDLEAEHQARCAFTEDHTEAVAAFNEKRRPVFKGT